MPGDDSNREYAAYSEELIPETPEEVTDVSGLLCRIARLRRGDSVISVESEAADWFDIRNPPLHPCYGRHS